MLKIRKGHENLKLRNCSAGFLFLLRLQFDFVFARGWSLYAHDQIASQPGNRAITSTRLDPSRIGVTRVDARLTQSPPIEISRGRLRYLSPASE